MYTDIDDRVVLKIYCYGQILLQTYEGVQFVCENPVDVVILFTLSFEELKGVICEKIDSQRSRRVSCILYRYPLSVFGGFVQFQTKYVTDEASMHEMFSMYMENRHRMSYIELYVEFEQSKADRNIVLEDYNSESEDEFESNYEIVGPGEHEDEAGGDMNADVAVVADALANPHPFQEPSFMRSLDLEAMHAPEFPQYMNPVLPVVADGEFTVGMEFSSREAVIKAMKDYTIRKENEVFEVREMPSGVEYAVDLRQRRCDCGEFQMDQVRRVYRARFRPLKNPATWPAYHGPRFVGNPFLRRVAKGRPKMTHFLNEMDTRMLRRPRRCKQCGADGHSRSKCRQSAGPSAGPAEE
ncbi:hypothetical protein Ahy_B01g055587 [Arachis hypogaea]|uniref:CCHC-type domain-containing protein n=1 Tax=Arachis hypogaea TaxID=3818 RepID=A0A445AWK7_ARAHY|nr:hypothetical protein Ahy_B01g055587 [Arachis hypogaea]